MNKNVNFDGLVIFFYESYFKIKEILEDEIPGRGIGDSVVAL